VTGAYTSGATSIHVPARVVIAADGRHSSLAFALNLARFPTRPKRWAFGAYFSGVRGLTSRGEMHIRPDGYIGVAPLPNGLANVCVVGERRGGRRADRLRPDDVIARALDDPALRPRFEHARRVSSVSVLGPLAVEVRRAGCPGLLLAGDAAGFVDPMTGDGLRFALRGGELAALAALDELESGVPAFERLGRMRARDFARKYRMNRVLRSLVSSPRAIGLATRLAARWPAPVRVLVAVAGDTHLARKAGLHGPPGAE
jgi:flavin-dependent dehydrogenase